MTPQNSVAESIGNGMQYGGAGGAVLFGLTLNELGVLVGMLVAVLGFFINWYYKHKSFLLQAQAYEERALARNRRHDDPPRYFMPDRD